MKYILLLPVLLSITGRGQNIPEPAYIVYSVKGAAASQKNNTKPVLLKPNQLIYPSETLIVNKGAEIALSNKDADYLIVKTPGSYKVSSLISFTPFRIAVNNVTKEYLRLLYNELLGTGYSYDKLQQSSTKKSWGGVSRGSSCSKLLYPANGFKTTRDSIRFVWQAGNSASSFLLQILDEQKHEIVNIQVRDTQYVLPVERLSQKEKGRYFWHITSNDAACRDKLLFYFDLMSNEQEEIMISSIVSPNANNSLLDELNIIQKLEQNGLIEAALKRFEKVLLVHPEDEALKKSYVLLLLQYGYRNQAKAILREQD